MIPEPKITVSRDFDYLDRMLNHPDIFPGVHDDVDVKLPNSSVLDSEENIFLKVSDGDRDVGFAMMLFQSFGRYEMHSGIIKDYAGRFALKAGHSVIKWIFSNTTAEEIITSSWSNARNVMWAARQVGFVEQSREPWKNKVRGENVDLIHYSIQKLIVIPKLVSTVLEGKS